MADATTNRTIISTPNEIVVHLTNISDGTGESAVVKIDKSTLATPAGAEPSSLAIERVRWSIQGMTSVRILWDHTTDDVALVLSGSGFDDFRGAPGDLRDLARAPGLDDPKSTGGTGDILLTTNGQVSGGSYDITLWARLVP